MNSCLQILILFTAVSLGTAIHCYTCNSKEFDDCYDLPESSRSKYLKDCDAVHQEELALGEKDHANYTLCRKLHMFMDQEYTKLNPAQDRIHRACGYVEDDGSGKKRGDCYYKSGYNTRTWVCSCNGESCNGATSLSVPVAALFAAVVAVLAART